jgi:hypothetical protein
MALALEVESNLDLIVRSFSTRGNLDAKVWEIACDTLRPLLEVRQLLLLQV